ncbi:hypothetical protein NUW58_g6380 [Xylaria curta]|uniref:Uncharacterized protein n=1 Tax=Xylaria curta TaxID=42375 RepID=A0ACC1NTS0_9PEZI|nr:hypothetical protein NUW58_g6380 [Xylaria curta]
MVNDTYPRGQYPSRPGIWNPGRLGAEYYLEDGRYGESPEIRGRPMTIDRALPELCGIPGKVFFVAAEDNGKVFCLSTPVGSLQLEYEKFFDRMGFLEEAQRIQQVPPDIQSFNQSEPCYDTEMSTGIPDSSSRIRGRRPYSNSTADSRAVEATRRSKKRPRAGSKQSRIGISRPSNISMVTIQPRKGIKIGDSDAVYAFYDHRLKCCQQTACKLIAKAWVKAVAPKKQSTHPYTRGDKTRPDWWPKTYCRFGEDTYKELRHKEPDHLERVYLLCHILRLLVEPQHKQHHAIRKVNLDLDGLELVTFEALSSWLSDKDAPANANKRSLLKDIFNIARKEAQYKDGELDGDTEVFVMPVSSDEARKAAASDTDDEDDIDRTFTPASSGTSSVEPNGPQIMMPQAQVNEHAETGHFAGNAFPDSVGIRAAHYTHPGFDPELPERPNYVETPGMGNHAPNYSHGHLGLPEMYPSPQGTSRRPSVFNTPSDYGSPATPVVYSPWSTSTTTPASAPMYGFQPQPPSVQAFGGQMAQSSSYSTPSIDGLPRQAPDTHHGDIFASRSLGQNGIQHQPAYPNYVADSASLAGSNVKTEGGNHPSILH